MPAPQAHKCASKSASCLRSLHLCFANHLMYRLDYVVELFHSVYRYTVDATCNPPQPNPYLLNQVKLQSQHKWVTENATGFGVQFFNTT